MKHAFKLVETGDYLDREFNVFECTECLQFVRIEKIFMVYLLTHKPVIPFAMRALTVPSCNLKRSSVTIKVPEVPMCTACTKRAVANPGSSGLKGALCMVCVYDL